MRALGSAPWTTAWAASSSSRADVFLLYLEPKTKVCAAVWGGPHREFGFSLSHLWVSLCCHKTDMLLLILIQINFNTGMKTLTQHFLLSTSKCRCVWWRWMDGECLIISFPLWFSENKRSYDGRCWRHNSSCCFRRAAGLLLQAESSTCPPSKKLVMSSINITVTLHKTTHK